jgi:hypothetical protein
MTISAVSSASALTTTASTRRPTPPALTGTASLLGISTSQLSSDLQSGTTLSSLASSAGVSSSALLTSVKSDLTANAPSGAPALNSDQLTAMASGLIEGTAPGSAAGGASSASASANLESIAGAIGIDPDDLLSQLKAGGDVSSLLSAPGETGYGSSLGDSISGGLAVDEYA